MNWNYYLPHIWDGNRAVWEDIYLLPDAGDPGSKSIWLTVDALGDASDPSHGSDREEFQTSALEKLGDKEFWIDGADMIVRARDFSKEELLGWVRIWLAENGLPVSTLVEAPFEDFSGTNEHASIIGKLCKGESPDGLGQE